MQSKLLSYIAFFTGIAISAVAAYYSIIGLTDIFAGSFWPVVIMGSVLEVGKLVATSWLYNNWKIAPLFIKVYLTSAVVVLMLITSMGIFGFLSRAHIEQTLQLNTGVTEQIEILDNDIRFQQDRITDLDKQIKVIDDSITKMIEKGQTKSSLNAAKQQKETRQALVDEKKIETGKLSQIKTEKIKLESQFKKIEAEVGPIKYVAEMIYGSSDEQLVDKAIRFVIILLIFVFDPLAVLLLLAFNISIRQGNRIEFFTMDDLEKEENGKV
jgi:hypothetical protein